MNKVKKIWSVTGLSVALLLTGCSDSAPRDTAEAVLGSIFESKASNPEELALLKGMPEYGQAVDCLANHLDQSGWNSDQHEFFMSETRNTGNIKYLDSRKYSESEQIEHFGPLFSSSCL